MKNEDKMSRFDFYRIAKGYEAKGEYERAIEAFGKAIELAEDYAHAWYYKGQLHYKMGQYKDAIDCGKRVLEIEPSWESNVVKMLRDAKEKLG
jgi:tetratricopeptide (TPR) repeat protein